MKRYPVWFSLMLKRMLKNPAFVVLLLVMPVFAFVISKAEQGESTGSVVGIMADDRQLLAMFTEPETQGSVFTFHVYENKEHLIRDVERGELICGIIFPEDLEERLDTGIWQDSITIYKSSSAGMTEIVKERIAGILFTLYSNKSYVNYIGNTNAFLQAEENGITREEIILFAQEAYESRLADGSTFALAYFGENPIGQLQENELDTSTFRLRGVLAICIFLSGLCGLLTDWKDRGEKRFVRIVPNWVTTAVNIWIPTIYTSVMTLLCLAMTGQLIGAGSGQWRIQLAGAVKEIDYLLFYQFLIVCYCSIIRLLLRKQEMIAAAVPILTFASIICCPVWIHLATYVPFFRILEKLFPATYYLLL